jgi:hypothetical protein
MGSMNMVSNRYNLGNGSQLEDQMVNRSAIQLITRLAPHLGSYTCKVPGVSGMN